jgi:hypothetical protein
MTKLDVTKLAETTLGLLPPEVTPVLTVLELAAQLTDLLYGDRGTIPALEADLITLQEAADVTAARLDTWLVDRSGRTLRDGFLVGTVISAVIARAIGEAR